MQVGLIFTGATEEILSESPELALNMADPPEVIEAVAQALEAGGHTVIRFNTDRYLPARLTTEPLDIVFNIATGFYGDSRQANVPAMLEYLQIPHTGSGVLAETLTVDKPLMKTWLMAHDLPTPAFQVFHRADDKLDPRLSFPLIVKLPAEGGSLGMTPDSVVQNETELQMQVALLLEGYQQDALVEAYIAGREFTVSVLGNDPPYCLPIVERLYFDDVRIQLDEPETTLLEIYQQMTGKEVKFTTVNTRSVAPASLLPHQVAQIEQATLGAYQLLGCRDWARIDLRMDEHGHSSIIDVNLEPAIAPDYALDKAAQAAGWTYNTLINRILGHAVERYPHLRDLWLGSEGANLVAAALTD